MAELGSLNAGTPGQPIQSRSAKRANEGLVCIATAILAMEVLSTGFAGWGTSYPEARKKAQALLQEYIPSQRAWLIKR
jgi:hypothetical protein